MFDKIRMLWFKKECVVADDLKDALANAKETTTEIINKSKKDRQVASASLKAAELALQILTQAEDRTKPDD